MAPGRIALGVLDVMTLLVLAGIPTGVLVGGAGGRLAMFVLRRTSPPSALGVTSDDGFTIGRTTASGTYNLLLLGAVLGVFGAGLYLLVRPLLLGPRWFRRCTVAAACGAVVGAIIIHPGGVDFTLLAPRWLAVTLFVALPTAFGGAIAIAVDAVLARRHGDRRAGRPGGREGRESAEGGGEVGRRGRGGRLPAVVGSLALVAAFPASLLGLLLASPFAVIAAWGGARHPGAAAPVPAVVLLAARGAWLAIAVIGLAALIGDLRAVL